jgi:hypothetical protein
MWETHKCKNIEDCESCRGQFERAKSYCGNCWKVVTNAAYFAKNSKHISGKCRERHFIPDSIYRRTVDDNCGHSSQWWTDFRNSPDQILQRQIKELERQNRLLRELLAA